MMTFLKSAASILIVGIAFGFCWALFDGSNRVHEGIELAASCGILLIGIAIVAFIWSPELRRKFNEGDW